MARNVALQVLRGILSARPNLQDGEFYFAEDTGQLYVGWAGDAFPVGAPAAVQVSGHALPNNYLEPNADGSVDTSPGIWTGLAPVMKTGQLTTTAITANQQVFTYTVTTGKTLYLSYLDIAGRLTTMSGTASVLGTAVVQVGGVTVYTGTFVNPTTGDSGSQAIRLNLGSVPIPFFGTTIITVLVTPAAATSMLWTANIGGYEK